MYTFKDSYNVITLKENEKLLRTPSKDVPTEMFGTTELDDFLEKLYEAMMNFDVGEGWMQAGISAIQVGEPLNIFYAYDGNADNYVIYINPQLEYLGDSTDSKEESCLSIPDQIGPVRRHKRVRVTYYDPDGKKIRQKLSGWNARVAQHEYDHLQGVLFIDKLDI